MWQSVILYNDFCLFTASRKVLCVPFCHIMVWSVCSFSWRGKLFTHTHTQKKGKHSERKLEWQSKGRILLSSCQTVMRSFGALCSLFFWSISLVRVVEADWQPGAAVPHLCSLTLSLCLHVYSSCSLYSAWSAMAKNPDNKDDDAFYSCTHRHAT